MTYRIDPKTRRLIVTDLTPPIRRRIASLASSIKRNAAFIDEQEEKNFITNRVIKSLLSSLYQEVDWDEVDLWDIAWEEWIEPVVFESDYNNHKARHQNGGADEISATGLSGLLADDQHVLDAEVKLVFSTIVCFEDSVVCNNDEVVSNG